MASAARRRLPMRAGLAAILLWIATPWTAHADDSPLTCVEDLMLPHFSGVYAHDVPAIVRVSITVGDHGRAAKIGFDPADTPFATELRDDFQARSRYSEGCSGRSLIFVVRYTVEGTHTDFPVFEIRLRPPNEILLICRPLSPTLGLAPPRPPSTDLADAGAVAAITAAVGAEEPPSAPLGPGISHWRKRHRLLREALPEDAA